MGGRGVHRAIAVEKGARWLCKIDRCTRKGHIRIRMMGGLQCYGTIAVRA